MPTISYRKGKPSNTEKVLVAWAYGVATSMEDWQSSLDFVASGDSLDAYEVEVTKKDKVTLLAADYIQYSVRGRGPGGFPPVDDIEAWLTIKGIQPSGGISIKSLAFLIARKIANEGNQVYRGEREGIPVQQIIEESFDSIEMDKAVTLMALQSANEFLASMYKVPNTKVK